MLVVGLICISDSVDMNLSKLQETVKDREAWLASPWGRKESDMTEEQQKFPCSSW